jgi:hypothetical protein
MGESEELWEKEEGGGMYGGGVCGEKLVRGVPPLREQAKARAIVGRDGGASHNLDMIAVICIA